MGLVGLYPLVMIESSDASNHEISTRKMAEGKKLVDEMLATANKRDYGPFPPVRKYTPWISGGNAINTIILEVEWEILAQMAKFFEKVAVAIDRLIAKGEIMEIGSFLDVTSGYTVGKGDSTTLLKNLSMFTPFLEFEVHEIIP